MASFYELPIPDLLRYARDLYTNARDAAEVFAIVSAEPYSFTTDDFDAGLALVQAVTDAEGAEAREDLESQQATEAYDLAVAAVRKAYVRHRDQLRKHYRRGTPEYAALRLAGDAPDDLLADAARLYDTLDGRSDIVAAVRGISPAGITDAKALVAMATKKGSAQTKEAGDVDKASRTRTTAVAVLRRHAAMTASDLAYALEDHPQLRERLGLLERTGRGS